MVAGCPRASRNSIIHRYLIYRRSVGKLSTDSKRKQVNAACTNVRSLAIKKRPDLFPRGRGQVRWELDRGMHERKEITHKGDSRKLAAYIEDHRAELEAEV